MHSVRLICLVLGAWLAGGFFMAWIATEGFRGVDRLLGEPNPTARLQFKTLDQQNSGPSAARMLLRYQVSEQNRFYFESWEIAQLVLGSLLFFFVLFGTREDKYSLAGVLLMLLLVAAQRFVITPEITDLGRALDFSPGDASPVRGRFWMLHNIYTAMELAKWAAGIVIAGRLVIGRRRRQSRRDVREQFDVVDKADHRHVDR